MFVAIDNIDMDALKVEEWIKTNRDANGGVISPEFAMEILGKTNHFAHIKKVINNIKKACLDENGKLVKDKVAPYKEFILSCVDRREMSPQAMAVLQELAETGGFVDEFNEANDKTKIYEVKDCENTDVKIIKSKEEFGALAGENLRVFYDADYIYLEGCYLGEVKSLKFKKGAEVSLYKAKHFTKDLDVSMCSYVNLSRCDLEGLKLKFREGAVVDLSDAYNLPKDLDVSMCSKVNLIECDLSRVEKITFREGAEVDLHMATELPKELDLSMCSKVDLRCCDLDGLKLKFREGADVNLNSATNLPKDLDFSMCSKVNLMYCNLSDVETIKFREGAVVDLSYARDLPKELDLSMCSKVNLEDCNLTGVEKIKFKDKEQEKEFIARARYYSFSGKVEYVGDDEKGKVMPMNNNGMEM